MTISDQILEIAKKNNGVVTTSDLSEKGILRGNLKKLHTLDGKIKASL